MPPDFVYVVDEETAKNVEISLKKPDGTGLYQIPTKFSDCFENFINQTIFIKRKSTRILRIEPIVPNDNGGLTYVNDKKNKPENPFKSNYARYFGGNSIYNRDTAILQLSANLGNLKRVIGETGNLYIIVRMINLHKPNLIAVFISKITPPLTPRPRSQSPSEILPPSRTRSQSLPTINGRSKYFYKYLKYKQKYLEAQQLYGEELKGGDISTYIIYCPEKIYNLINELHKVGFKKFKNLDCFFLTLGSNSFYSTNEDNTFKNCWTTDNLDANVKSIGKYKTFNLSLNDQIWTINIQN